MITGVKGAFLRAGCIVAVACVGAAMPAMAQDGTGKNGEFVIHNDTKNNIAVGFYTNDGSGWSTNWLRSKLEAGDTANMKFNKPGGKCKQTLRIGWQSKSGGEVKDDPINIDICKASNVYLHDNDVSFD